MSDVILGDVVEQVEAWSVELAGRMDAVALQNPGGQRQTTPNDGSFRSPQPQVSGAIHH
jgi:hypothetical protein